MTAENRDRGTQPPAAPSRPYDPDAEQRALAAALAQHADPSVRLIAAMSQRLLDLHDLVSGVSARQTELETSIGSVLVEMRKGFDALEEKLGVLSKDQGELEGHVTELRTARATW